MHAPATQVTLLERIRDPQDEASWRRFEGLYRELVVRTALRAGLQVTDADDVAQAVFASLWRSMPAFTLDRAKGRFRDYLFRAIHFEIIRHKKRMARPMGLGSRLPMAESSTLEDPHALDPTARILEQEWIDHHLRLAMDSIRKLHTVRSVEMFERMLAGASIEQVADEFATTPWAVRKVKQRIREALQHAVREQFSADSGG